jgi:hypothetical protein
MVNHLHGIGIEDDRQNVLFTLQSCFQMMYGMIAITVICHYFGREKASNVPTHLIDIDYNLIDIEYNLPCIELEFRRNEIDSIEKELVEIESDLRIDDDISHLREITLHAQKTRLKAILSRHKGRIEEMGY